MHCPCCGADLDGGPIPAEMNQPYEYEGKLRYPYGTADARWERQIGMGYLSLYDGILEWCCPDCYYKWPSEAGRVLYGVVGASVYNPYFDSIFEITAADKGYVYLRNEQYNLVINRLSPAFEQLIWLDNGLEVADANLDR